jgi:predicted dehydrogenase
LSRLRIGQAGLGYWGKNLARNFDELADLRWLCDASPELQAEFAERYPNARVTGDFAEMLADPDVDAVVIATPVPTHFALAKQALEAGKHVFVEKPPAMRAEEMDELVTLAEERDLVLMPGHLLLYHPGVLKLKELVDAGELGEVLCVYGNRVNLGIVREKENALWSLGVHDLSVILHLLDEDPELATAQGSASIHPGIEDVVFCFLRFPSGKIAHMHLSWLDPHKMRKMTVVGREKMVVFDDMEPEQKVTIYEKRVSPTGEAFSGDASTPAIDMTEPLRRECTYFLELVAGEHDRIKVARDGARVVRALEMLTTSLKGNAALTEPLPDLATLSDVDLTKLIDELTLEEPDISNRRRLLHGKIDILRAELYDRLANGEGSTGG